VRDAPAIDIARTLLSAGAEVTGFDPEAWETFQQEVPDIEIAMDMYSALDGADAVVICTEWAQFSAPAFEQVKALLNSQVIFDGRNIYTPEDMRELGFQYYSVGRPTMEICAT
jgi:UDPglucose 6-dehydrogenase